MGKIIDYINKHPMSILLGIVFVLAFFGIGCGMMALVLAQHFDWRWLLFFDLPLTLFISWALGTAGAVAHRIIEDEHKNS